MNNLYRPSGSQADRIANVSTNAARETSQQVRRVVQTPIARHRGIPQDYAPPETLIMPAIVTTAIPPCTVAGTTYTPGKGAATAYWIDVDAGDTHMKAGTDDLVTFDVYNWYPHSTTVAAGVFIWVVCSSARWWFLTSDCPS